MSHIKYTILTSLSPFSKWLKRHSALYRYLHRIIYAIIGIVIRKKSYSRFGEDRIIYDFLKNNGGIHKDWIYIDVGAYHPISISDTLIFYRKGYHGVCIEPNYEMAGIFRTFRPRDIILNAAAGNKHDVLNFYETDVPDHSSLLRDEIWEKDRVFRVYLVPVICLDDLMSSVSFERIFLLKIDTEGFDQAVLRGGHNLLLKTMVVLIEARKEHERKEVLSILGDEWKLLFSNYENMVFVNSRYFGGDLTWMKKIR